PFPATSAADFPPEVSVASARQLLGDENSRALLIDVREPWETQICQVANSTLIPMRRIPESLSSLPRDRYLLILCHHGSRSRQVTGFLRDRGFTAVSNVAGGITAWAEQLDPGMPRY
ncbi:MAG TPA: rhodanese-like domain-containing protein, partial [Opitutus sp.]|nr:rhodanese-like domain-containing protein [Opitutus sp.]